MVRIRLAGPEDVPACVRVLASLPDFFTPDTHDKYAAEASAGRTWVAEDDATGVCGFVHVARRHAASAEITFAAVFREYRRRGIGRALVSAALRELAEDDVAVVLVKTLDASSGYEPYVATRAFWESQGFVQVDMIDPLPGWQPGNPSAIYVAALRTTA